MSRFTPALLVTLAIAGLTAPPASADVLTITDGVATFSYDSDAPNGGNADLVSDSDTLFQETWFLRYSDPLLGPLTTELTGGVAFVDGKTGSLTFLGVGAGIGTTGYDIVLDYEVNDNDGVATLIYSATITNTNSASGDVSLFNYFDHDLDGAGNDSATYVPGRMDISDAGGLAIFRETTVASHWQIEAWGNDLDNDIRTEVLTVLQDTGSPFGPGDFTGALQWDLTLAPDETAVINGIINVPEPASGLLLGLGALAICARRRRRG